MTSPSRYSFWSPGCPDRTEEYLRFDVLGQVPHYHYILNEVNHNMRVDA